MRRVTIRCAVLAACAAFALCGRAAESAGRITLDVETGAVFSGYNDVRIPGTTGTLLSLSQELETDPEAFGRVRLSCALGDRGTISVLMAPLTLNASGILPRDVDFQNVVFPAGTRVEAKYRFDSYRLTYRYRVHESGNFRVGLGLTAKVRDAEVSLTGGGLESKKKNTGPVPLVNFLFEWRGAGRMGVLLEGDALAAPQGRAEDVLAAVSCRAAENVELRAGYRILEGGADNDEVYSFALVHYAVVGVTIRL